MSREELESRQDAIYDELMRTSALQPEFERLLSELRAVQVKLYKYREKVPNSGQVFNISFLK